MFGIGQCRSLVSKLQLRMSSSLTYEEAIQKLNSLQSNKATIEQIRKDIKTGAKCTNLEEMESFLLRTGVTLTKLDELSVIHVAGTKGKGSTSAMCESILRHHGYRTGFYSSPHLVAVRERIRLDGRVVSKEQFSWHFHQVYTMLEASKTHSGDMPKYFSFLTLLAYNVFLKERVDVAIVEVGIGGVVDYTNVLRKVPIVGITALGLDHTSILGHSLAEIAEAKAGIMKPGCVAYTVPQPAEAMDVLRRVARQVKCPLNIAPEYDSYIIKEVKPKLPVDIEAYRMNASLAIQLAHAWMSYTKLQISNRRSFFKKDVSGKVRLEGFAEIDPPFTSNNGKLLNENVTITTLPNETVIGLNECKWPGRYHVIRSDYANFYLDGAHTKESMDICAKWFMDNNRTTDKMLIFSATGDRDAEVLLKSLTCMNFTRVYFVIPTAFKQITEKNDNYSIFEQKELLVRCQKHAKIWGSLSKNRSSDKIFVLDCVSDALINIKRTYDAVYKSSVLITGSLHLVGAAISILDPNLSRD